MGVELTSNPEPWDLGATRAGAVVANTQLIARAARWWYDNRDVRRSATLLL